MEARINIVYSVWGAEGFDEPFSGGVQTVEVTPAFAPILAGAVNARVVELVDPSDELLALLDGHVETQEVSDAAYEEAVQSGAWRTGHLQQWITETEQRLALSNEQANLTDGDRAYLQDGLAKAHDELAALDPEAHAQVTSLLAARQTAGEEQ